MRQERILKRAAIQLELATEQMQTVVDFICKNMDKDGNEELEAYGKTADYVQNTLYEVLEKIRACL